MGFTDVGKPRHRHTIYDYLFLEHVERTDPESLVTIECPVDDHTLA
jgi:hypothetical protein